jgi:hypothetical protein
VGEAAGEVRPQRGPVPIGQQESPEPEWQLGDGLPIARWFAHRPDPTSGKFVVPLATVLAVKALVFGSAAIALYGLERSALALVFAILALLNTALATFDRDAHMHE